MKLIVLAPGHFHAALLQKTMNPLIDSMVHVYAPPGQELDAYLNKIESFNTRQEKPTKWTEKVYTGADFLKKMIDEKAGNIVVLAGNNQKKTDYIKTSVDAGLNVLSDKPMAIDEKGFNLLKDAFASAQKNKVLLYEIMTARHDILNMLQREMIGTRAIFGTLEHGTPTAPSVIKESVHHFFKEVAGTPLVRPAWYFDVDQQGEGIVDVTTHMVDLIQWSCFPDITIDYTKDIKMISAEHTPTVITKKEFTRVTQTDSYPAYLKKDIRDDTLRVFANGTMHYVLKGIHAKVGVNWEFQSAQGAGDTHYSSIQGSKARLIVRQGKEQNYKPVLTIEPVSPDKNYDKELETAFQKIQNQYPGITLKKHEKEWEVIVPAKYDAGHEAQFAQVAEKYISYLQAGKLPDWEVPNMLAKYYTTTQALKAAGK